MGLPFGRKSGILTFGKHALKSIGYSLTFGRKSGVLKFRKHALKSKGYSFTFWEKMRQIEVSVKCFEMQRL